MKVSRDMEKLERFLMREDIEVPDPDDLLVMFKEIAKVTIEAILPKQNKHSEQAQRAWIAGYNYAIKEIKNNIKIFLGEDNEN